MKRSWLVCIVALAFATTLVLGCGPAGRAKVETVKVSGTVTMDGKPLEGAQVNFSAAEYAGIATADASGKFELEAQPGENTVYIRKYEGISGSFDETMLSEGDAAGGGGPKQLVPPKYSDPAKTELKFSVPEDGTDSASFDLTSK